MGSRQNKTSSRSGLLGVAEKRNAVKDSADQGALKRSVPERCKLLQGAAQCNGAPKPGKALASLRIIGVDPGLASSGWGVVEYSKGRLLHIAHGCIETSAGMPRAERLLLIYDSFLKVLKTHNPREAAIENLYFGRNVSSALMVAEARGVLMMALAARNLAVLELTPNAIKKAVTGVTRAEKNQVMEMTRFLLSLPENPRPDHAADALAAAICAAHLAMP